MDLTIILNFIWLSSFCRSLVVLLHFLMKHGMPNDHLSCFSWLLHRVYSPVWHNWLSLWPMTRWEVMLTCSLSLSFYCIQYVSQVNTRDVCPEAVPDISKAQTICEAKVISHRFYNLSLCWRGSFFFIEFSYMRVLLYILVYADACGLMVFRCCISLINSLTKIKTMSWQSTRNC